MKIYDYKGRKNLCGTRFVTDYELTILAKVLGVSMEWLTEQEE